MSDIEKIIYAALFGVLIVIIGQIISKFFIEPMYELKKEIGGISATLNFYAGEISRPNQNDPIGFRSEGSRKLKQHACDIYAKWHAIPAYCILRFFFFFGLGKKSIWKAAGHLSALSVGIFGDNETENKRDKREIKTLLKIE